MLLPLQAPDQDRTELQYRAPTAAPLWLKGFSLNQKAIEEAPAKTAQLRGERPRLQAEHRAAERAYREAQRKLPANLLPTEREAQLAAVKQARDESFAALVRNDAEINDTIQAAYTQAGFPQLGPVSRWMVRTRYALFGEGGGQALADEIGVDLLGQVPLEPAVAAGGDDGTPVALDGDGPAAQALRAIAHTIVTETVPPVSMAGCSARVLEAVERMLGPKPEPTPAP